MSDRRRTWVRLVLKRIGRALVEGLTAMGSCTGAGVAMSAGMRMGSQSLDDHGDVEIRDEAMRGITEIEAFLATVDQPARRLDETRRRRRPGSDEAT